MSNAKTRRVLSPKEKRLEARRGRKKAKRKQIQKEKANAKS